MRKGYGEKDTAAKAEKPQLPQQLFAVYEGMKMPFGTKSVSGPFLIRLYKANSKYHAEMLPTKQEFYATDAEGRKTVMSNADPRFMQEGLDNRFDLRLYGWSEVIPEMARFEKASQI